MRIKRTFKDFFFFFPLLPKVWPLISGHGGVISLHSVLSGKINNLGEEINPSFECCILLWYSPIKWISHYLPSAFHRHTIPPLIEWCHLPVTEDWGLPESIHFFFFNPAGGFMKCNCKLFSGRSTIFSDYNYFMLASARDMAENF